MAGGGWDGKAEAIIHKKVRCACEGCAVENKAP